MLLRAGSLMLGSLVWLSLLSFLASGQAARADEYYDWGVRLYNQRNFKGAAPYFESSMKNSPWDSSAMYYAALTYHQLGNFSRAKQLYREILTRYPGTEASRNASAVLQKLDPDFVRKASAAAAQAAAGGQAAAGSAGAGAAGSDFDNLPSQGKIYFTRRLNSEIVDAEVNGRRISMVYDTGASGCVFGKNHLRQLGINPPTGKPTGAASGVGSNGVVPVWEMKVTLKVGNLVRHNFPVMVQDELPTDPLLGETFFGSLQHTTDNGANCIYFSTGGSGAAAQSPASGDRYVVPFTRIGREMIVNVQVNGKSCPMIFDTGADNICFSEKQLQQLGISIPEDAEKGTSTGIGGQTESSSFTVPRMKLGPVEKSEVRISCVKDSNMFKPLLGQNFFRDWQYTVDNAASVIRFVRR